MQGRKENDKEFVFLIELKSWNEKDSGFYTVAHTSGLKIQRDQDTLLSSATGNCVIDPI